jgi:putative flippase GtrA
MSRANGIAVIKKNREQFVRFLLVGFSNFAISFLVFQSLLHLPEIFRPSIFVAQLLSYSAGTVWSYIWNRNYTFRSSGRPISEATRFVILQCLLAVVSAAMMGVMAQTVDLSPTMIWFLVMTGVTVANYFLSRHWAFRV